MNSFSTACFFVSKLETNIFFRPNALGMDCLGNTLILLAALLLDLCEMGIKMGNIKHLHFNNIKNKGILFNLS